MKNHCISCGGCCAGWKIYFPIKELEPKGTVPKKMADKFGIDYAVLKHTDDEIQKCKSLDGDLGKSVSCTKYDVRPTICREFKPSYEDGVKNIRCDQARSRVNLPPLTPEDWK